MGGNLERVAGIEPAPSAWKAEVLPLNYTRLTRLEGEGFEPSKLARQIYSLFPLTAREPLQNEGAIFLDSLGDCQDCFRRLIGPLSPL